MSLFIIVNKHKEYLSWKDGVGWTETLNPDIYDEAQMLNCALPEESKWLELWEEPHV